MNEKISVPPAEQMPVIEIKYHLDSISNKAALLDFNNKYDSAQKIILFSLNRISPDRMRIGIKFIAPDTMYADRLLYSPLPAQLKAFDSIPKLIVISQRVQAFGAYENGKLLRWGPTSTGRKAKQTPNGLFHTNYKARLKISTVDGDWKMPWYFNISNKGGIGMHQYTLPGYPASHSCVRMLEEDAIWIFNWAEQWQLSNDETRITKYGTPVIIFGHYEFGMKAPWKNLTEDPKATQFTEQDRSEINAFLPQLR